MKKSELRQIIREEIQELNEHSREIKILSRLDNDYDMVTHKSKQPPLRKKILRILNYIDYDALNKNDKQFVDNLEGKYK